LGTRSPFWNAIKCDQAQQPKHGTESEDDKNIRAKNREEAQKISTNGCTDRQTDRRSKTVVASELFFRCL